ncbi:MAG: tRNA (adenosine(37)-N6)-threonylcarbamoyltransferase complex dimerization subunit type 1 TsaB [Acholeplasmatales bacterium]|nr:tRNA (adenosine(37)-N6)-threonylcarbamoyltransferase complex dimerization subunit type 1 TsaB [Acholeplasmatales bacterium]
MYTLIIDSATKVLYHALVKDDKVVAEAYTTGQNDHAKNIVAIVEKFLKQEGITTDDLNKIICGIGPGSYTGVRMAVTVAKMLGAFKHITVYEISTLSLISSGAKGRCLALIDARRGNAFAGIYENGKLVGNELIANKEEFLKNEHDSVVTESEYTVNPFVVIENACLHDNPHSLKPNYLQETEAERNLEANENKKNA